VEQAMAQADLYRPHREAYYQWVFGERGLERQARLIGELRRYAG
jgi:hypothetical protein